MAVRILNAEASELCLGKPELTWISADSTVSDALTALKRSRETYISVWSCSNGNCVCVGKISVADVSLFLCKEANLADPLKAFETLISEILVEGGGEGGAAIVRHLEPNSSLLEAIDHILEGTQNLVIPRHNPRSSNSRKKFINNPSAYCWLTQEDVVRYFLNSISAFSSISTLSIDSLGIIDHDVMTVHYDKPASTALEYFRRSLTEQKSIAVIDEDSRLIGEISPFTLACCDETAAAAIMALSAGELMAYLDFRGPPEDLVGLVKTKLEEKNLGGILDFIEEFSQSLIFSSSSSSSSCSSEDELWSNKNGGSVGFGRRHPGRMSEAIVCGPRSSLVAVMIQLLAHRNSCAWVVEEDYTIVGIVTFAGILKVFRSFASERDSK